MNVTPASQAITRACPIAPRPQSGTYYLCTENNAFRDIAPTLPVHPGNIVTHNLSGIRFQDPRFPSNSAVVHSGVTEIQLLRHSCSQLHETVRKLAEEVVELRRSTVTARPSPSQALHDVTEYAIRRTTLFARRSAIQMLLGPSKELSYLPPYLCPATSVRKITLKSKSVNCSLFEFRQFMRACYLNPSINCAILPSQHEALDLFPVRITDIRIIFPTYFDFCTALEIDVPTREDGIYRTKKDRHGAVRANSNLGNRRNKEKQILIGKEEFFPVSAPQLRLRTLHCYRAYVYFNEMRQGLSSLGSQDLCVISKLLYDKLRNQLQFRQSVRSAETQSFSVNWKKTEQVPFHHGSSEEHSIGILTLNIPAIVLRGRLPVQLPTTFFFCYCDRRKILESGAVFPLVGEIAENLRIKAVLRIFAHVSTAPWLLHHFLGNPIRLVKFLFFSTYDYAGLSHNIALPRNSDESGTASSATMPSYSKVHSATVRMPGIHYTVSLWVRHSVNASDTNVTQNAELATRTP